MLRSFVTLAAVSLVSATPLTAHAERRARADGAKHDAKDGNDGPEAEALVTVRLDDIIEVAVRHAPDLARAKVERAVAKGEAGAARRDQAWVLGAQAQFVREGMGGDVDVEPLTVVATDEQRANVSLGRNLPTGGKLSLELGFHRDKREYAISPDLFDRLNDATANNAQPQQVDPQRVQEFATNHRTSASLSLTQPLLRGLGPDVALAGERRAALEYTAATINTQLEAEKMVLGVVSAYWELAYAAHEVDVRFEALDLAQRQEKATRDAIRAGTVPQSSLNAVLYQLSIREEAKLTSQLEYEQKSLELRRKAGMDIGRRELVLKPGEPFEPRAEEWEVDAALAAAKRSNRRLAALGLQKRVADLDVKVTKNAMLPQVDLSVSGGLVGAGASADAAFDNATTGAGFRVMAGLSLQWEISGAASSAHDAAVAKKTRFEVERRDAEREIDTEVVAAVHAVTAARTRIRLADRASAVAEENIKAERAAFEAARSDNFKVLERQSELVEARLRRGRAISDYHVAVARLQYLTGTLLSEYRVDVLPRQRRQR